MDKIISKYMSDIAKISHKKSPRGRDHFKLMQKKSAAKRRENRRLSTPTDLRAAGEGVSSPDIS